LIDLKVKVQDGTRVSKDSGVRKVRNETPASLMTNTGKNGKRPLIFKKTYLLIKKIY
jgi:hypothetical protein